eukprot:Em0001g736a
MSDVRLLSDTLYALPIQWNCATTSKAIGRKCIHYMLDLEDLAVDRLSIGTIFELSAKCIASKNRSLGVSSLDTGVERSGARLKPRLLDGSQLRLLDGSQPRLLDGSQPRLLDGSQPRLFDGSQPRLLDGFQPRLPDGWPGIVKTAHKSSAGGGGGAGGKRPLEALPPPQLAPFNMEQFLHILEVLGTQIMATIKGNWIDLYRPAETTPSNQIDSHDLSEIGNCNVIPRAIWTVDKYLVPLELLTVYEKWDFVSYEDSIFMLHGGIIVPELFKKTVLETLCNGYPGVWTM